ncbi:MAG: chloride channel protein [Planctomycetota bacterium]
MAGLHGVARRMVLGVVIGIVAGAAALVFNLACDVVSHGVLDWIAGYRPRAPHGEHEVFQATDTPFRAWLLPICAAVGGLLSGWVVYRFAPEAGGHGTDAAIDAFHAKEGKISGKVPIIKIIASALTIGSGGSGGREGPIAQVGAGFGSFLATKLGLGAHERRLMLASGMGAGVGSIFHAPLAGALFAAEIFYSEAEIESEALIPAAVSTIVGYSLFSSVTGFEPLFAQSDHAFRDPRELLLYTVLAVILTASAWLFVVVFYGIHDRFSRWRIHPVLRPAVGGALTGLLGLGALTLAGGDLRALDVLSFGYGTLEEALLGTAPLTLLLLLAVGKMLTTSISIGSGGSGGVFGPSMVIGGTVGGSVGIVAKTLFPSVVANPGSYALVGMAGFFAAAAKAPISTLVMVSEMTGNYRMIVPALWVSSLCFLLGRRFKLYRSQVGTRLESGAHQHEMFVDLLAQTSVRRLFEESPTVREFATVHQNLPLDRLIELFGRTTQHYFPVVDDAGAMVAILSANDVRQFVTDGEVGAVVIASDLANPSVVTLTLDTDLQVALGRFVSLDVDALPVVDPQVPTKVIGMLSRRELIRTYHAMRERFRARTSA